MNNYNVSYVTKAGVEISISLPLNEYGEILAERYLSDSERRKLSALRLKASIGELEAIEITLH